ncbi:DNA primase large subunit, putative [Trypanosoma equiperdum]|uniref:DNA primase large subunit n=3 Tax=Trypanozoon TaxID=39700 RepID=Q38BT5_TRYB2|nr:DNA primase large subunit, putative [Trypanosoma brucei gambiense DAL972]XP_822563.1 DNA primase large subunit, putative [Trypanosoma brucei brucei TREU927]EAN77735.1 DNA primase large subunit, putative [Trypanosoma brucei brucei TREU927]CBH15309.1 DNA primase large subunit, putative [Trypanosoma brucei gambiense DAL972]SCU72383.1 DNA primase large subunit, putative [Trypanosoma equiperdum]|eukprot:XP_011777574.1 DNA primase large subunit, putative [Trypanosoma brucei gambiense DAL972]
MQAIGTSPKAPLEGERDLLKGRTAMISMPDWSTMYTCNPAGNKTLFELEAIVVKRLELLGWIDQLLNSPNMKNLSQLLDEVGAHLPLERRKQSTQPAADHVVLGRDSVDGSTSDTPGSRAPRHSSRSLTAMLSTQNVFVFEGDEDLLSHRLARFVFCMSEKWRKWFVRTEEMLLRARLRLQLAKCEADFLPNLMRLNGLPCDALTDDQQQDPRLQKYIIYHTAVQGKGQLRRADEYFLVPLSLATRLIKARSVLCLRGHAILHRDQVQEVFVTMFLSKLNKGLHEAYLARMKLSSHEDHDERETVMKMLDAFLEYFIEDTMNEVQEASAGAVGAGDVRHLAQTHFPLCMRQVDEHLRREGHLKHQGRFTYGLFLKAIGLSMQDSMVLFSSLMTLKAGAAGKGDPESFAKTSYGYNIRHNYGMEGKKTSYSSLSCTSLLGLPPVVDKFDCHGCPFRFKNESAFRGVLLKEQLHPLGKGHSSIRLAASDIEDIIQDCKGQHYTRACYKYFMATHPGARRDTLFRSPHEYYVTSREMTDKVGDSLSDSTPAHETPGRDNLKRSIFTPTLREDVVRPRDSL